MLPWVWYVTSISIYYMRLLASYSVFGVRGLQYNQGKLEKNFFFFLVIIVIRFASLNAHRAEISRVLCYFYGGFFIH